MKSYLQKYMFMEVLNALFAVLYISQFVLYIIYENISFILIAFLMLGFILITSIARLYCAVKIAFGKGVK